jgi:hypothetical protein
MSGRSTVESLYKLNPGITMAFSVYLIQSFKQNEKSSSEARHEIASEIELIFASDFEKSSVKTELRQFLAELEIQSIAQSVKIIAITGKKLV